MEFLSDNALIEAYNKAIKLNLDEDFLTLLSNELIRRKIVHTTYDDNLHKTTAYHQISTPYY